MFLRHGVMSCHVFVFVCLCLCMRVCLSRLLKELRTRLKHWNLKRKIWSVSNELLALTSSNSQNEFVIWSFLYYIVSS